MTTNNKLKLRRLSVQKLIIRDLREGPRSESELRTSVERSGLVKGTEALRKVVPRYIQDFVEQGLVIEKDDGLKKVYAWHVYPNLFRNKSDYSSKLAHSKQMIQALLEIASLSNSFGNEQRWRHVKALVLGAESHLAAYPILDLLTSYRKNVEVANSSRESLLAKLAGELDREFGELVIDDLDRLTEGKSFVDKTLSEAAYVMTRYRDRPIVVERRENGSIWLSGSPIASGDVLLTDRVEFFVRKVYSDNTESVTRIRGLEEEAQKLHLQVQEFISELILRIEVGEPLLGKCDVCPNFAILDPSVE